MNNCSFLPAVLLLFTGFFYGCRHGIVVYPQRRPVIEAVYATGRIIPSHEISVVAPGGGILKKCRVKNGERVNNGQLLFLLNPASPGFLMGQPSRAVSDIDPKTLAYLKNMSPAVTLPPELLKSGTNVATLPANAFSQAVSIRSPAAGKVFQVFHIEGETVRQGDVLALIGHPTERTIQLNVDQKDILRIREGQKVLIRDELHPGVTYEGIISSIYPILNEVSYTFRVDATIPGGYPDSIYIHMPVEGNIIIRENPNALVIPRVALFTDDSVIIRKGNSSVKTFIRKGIQTFDHIEVIEGLDEQSAVVMPEKRNNP
jgi:biotin carboxyl carrier protein